MIREAKQADYPIIAAKAADFYEFSGLAQKGLWFDCDLFFEYLVRLQKMHHVKIIVAERESDIIGSVAGIISQWYLQTSQTIVQEHWFWVDPDCRGMGYDKRLINALIEWGKDQKASFCIMNALSGFERKLGPYYSKFGFSPLESNFIKEI